MYSSGSKEDSMTKLDHWKAICFLVCGVVIMTAVSCSQNPPAVSQQNANTATSQQTRNISAEQIAKTYGLDSFDQVEAIRYTWNAQFPGLNVSRTWTWEPKTNQVTFEGKDKDGKPVKVTYNWEENGSAKSDTHVAKSESDAWTLKCGSGTVVKSYTMELAE